MRAFSRRMSVCLPFFVLIYGLLFGCSGGEPEPAYVCGDNVCERADGENSSACPNDCVDYICGNEVCEETEGETDDNCPEDCLICMEPFSVNCNDGSCWSDETDCASGPLVCGDIFYRCNASFPYATCCDGIFRLCPPTARYWCPVEDKCYASISNCWVPLSARCIYRGLNCYPYDPPPPPPPPSL